MEKTQVQEYKFNFGKIKQTILMLFTLNYSQFRLKEFLDSSKEAKVLILILLEN